LDSVRIPDALHSPGTDLWTALYELHPVDLALSQSLLEGKGSLD
jgi:hypothetical protein